MSGHTDSVYALAFSKNGILASGVNNDKVILWNVTLGKDIRSLIGHTTGSTYSHLVKTVYSQADLMME